MGARGRRSSFKRYKSLSVEKHGERGGGVVEGAERSYSSTDNLALQALPRPRPKFRKAVSLASRLHSSPSTGRKLANYHLIASTKSGESPRCLRHTSCDVSRAYLSRHHSRDWLSSFILKNKCWLVFMLEKYLCLSHC
jgi:hypothetical protein